MIKDQALRNEHGAAQQHRQPQQQRPDGQQHHHHASIIQQSTRGGPYGPDEVLFRRLDAPQRYAEHDVYNAHERDLPQAGRDVLPDSHLLKSIHGYASKFYEAMKRRQNGAGGAAAAAKGSVDEQSMDETALLAFGILLEEASREILGRRGHLVFTQGRAARPGSGPHDQTDDVGGDDDTAHYSPHAAATAAAAAVGPSKSPPVRLAKRRRTS